MSAYFATSQDLLFFVLTIVIAVVGGLLAWLLYYLIAIIRRANDALRGITATVDRIHALTENVQEAVSRSSSHLSLIVGMIKELIAVYGRRREKSSRKAKQTEEE